MLCSITLHALHTIFPIEAYMLVCFVSLLVWLACHCFSLRMKIFLISVADSVTPQQNNFFHCCVLNAKLSACRLSGGEFGTSQWKAHNWIAVAVTKNKVFAGKTIVTPTWVDVRTHISWFHRMCVRSSGRAGAYAAPSVNTQRLGFLAAQCSAAPQDSCSHGANDPPQ